MRISILREFTRSISSMTLNGYYLYRRLIFRVLDKNKNINKWRKDFMGEIFVLFLSIKGRINFYQFERYVQFTEQQYRQQFENPFDFKELNKELAFSYGSGRFAIAFDPSYFRKSGKLIVLFNGFQKKTQKTPLIEIEKAMRIKTAYFESKK